LRDFADQRATHIPDPMPPPPPDREEDEPPSDDMIESFDERPSNAAGRAMRSKKQRVRAGDH
jgi:hypothetical protein